MSDYEYLDTDTATSASDAERLIERRIEELRAAALGAPGRPATPLRTQRPRDVVLRSSVTAGEPTPVEFGGNGSEPAWQPAPEVGAQPEPVAPTFQAAAPTLPAVAPIQVTQHETMPATALAAAIERVEHAVQADVSRLEQVLRTWGDPNVATGRLAEQLHASMQRLEHTLRSDLTRVVEDLRANEGDSREVDERMIQAIASWSARSEQGLTDHTQSLRAELVSLGKRVEAGGEHAQRAAAASAAIAAAGIGDKLSVAVGELREPLLNSIATVEEAAHELQSSTGQVHTSINNVETELHRANGGLEQLTRQVTRVEGALTRARPADELIDRVQETVEAVQAEIGDHASVANELTAQVGATLEQHLALLGGQLTARLEQLPERLIAQNAESTIEINGRLEALRDRIGAVDGQLSSHIQELGNEIGARINNIAGTLGSQLQETRAGVAGDVQSLSGALTATVVSLEQRIEQDNTKLNDSVRHIAERVELQHDKLQQALTSDIERATQSLLASQDDVPEELTGRVTEAIDALGDRIDAHRGDFTRDAGDALASISAAIVDLRTNHEQEAQVARDIATQQLDAMRETLVHELDYNRLQHVRDIESLMDSMTSGWGALFERLSTSDERLYRLEQRIDQWFAALAD